MAATVNDVRCTDLPNQRAMKMVEAQVETKTRYEPDPDFSPPPDDDSTQPA
jgi:hypothetical protein